MALLKLGLCGVDLPLVLFFFVHDAYAFIVFNLNIRAVWLCSALSAILIFAHSNSETV